jgi:hypothetical protein
VVQTVASVFVSRFGLFASPTNNILEQTATGICAFADIDVICLRTRGPAAQIMLKGRITAKITRKARKLLSRFRTFWSPLA